MYTKQEREIYRYHNGICEVAADPLFLRRQIRLFAGEDPNKLAAEAEEAHREGATQEQFQRGHAAEETLVSAIRQAFGLPAFEAETGEGWTWADCLHLYNDFCDWLDQKKTTNAPSLTS